VRAALLQLAAVKPGPSAVSRFFWAALALIALAIILVLLIGVIIGPLRREARAGVLARRGRRRKRIKDAWAEAGRRAETPEAEDLEPGAGREGPG
jgi:hypothetical protein